VGVFSCVVNKVDTSFVKQEKTNKMALSLLENSINPSAMLPYGFIRALACGDWRAVQSQFEIEQRICERI